jgi:hypothetical protein
MNHNVKPLFNYNATLLDDYATFWKVRGSNSNRGKMFFSYPKVQTGSAANAASFSKGTVNVKLTTHIHLVLRLRICGDIQGEHNVFP